MIKRNIDIQDLTESQFKELVEMILDRLNLKFEIEETKDYEHLHLVDKGRD